MQEANKDIVKYLTTKVDIEFDGQKFPLEVPMADVQPVDVLLGCDVPLENLIIRQMTLESLEKLLCQMHSEKSLKEQPEQKMVLKVMEQVMVVIITKKKKQLQVEVEQKQRNRVWSLTKIIRNNGANRT